MSLSMTNEDHPLVIDGQIAIISPKLSDMCFSMLSIQQKLKEIFKHPFKIAYE